MIRAARIVAWGGPDVLRIDTVPTPEAGPGEVLVDVAAAGLNPVDGKIRAGTQRVAVRWTLPHGTGLDFAGRVAALGPGVSGFVVGDAVYGSIDHHGAGACAERVVCRAEELAPAPAGLTWVEAASLPLVAQTAWDALVVAGEVGDGTRVLVLGGGGGVGTLAVQLARARGAVVSATCSPASAERLTQLGATTVVDYTREVPAERLPPQDVVLDAVGWGTWRSGLRATRRGAAVMRIVGDIPAWVGRLGLWPGTAMAWISLAGFFAACALRGRRGKFVLRRPLGATLREITRLVEAKRIRPVVDRVYRLDQIVEAHAYLDTGRARGKVVVTVWEDAGGTIPEPRRSGSGIGRSVP